MLTPLLFLGGKWSQREKRVDPDEDRGHCEILCFKFYSHHILLSLSLSLSGLNSCGPKSCFSFLSWSDSWVRQKLGDHCSALRLILCD